jgi:glycosyltransferase involved in cell wall biosynthesis
MISRLLGDKGLREYGEAARRLKARHPEARFALVGYFDNSPDAISREELAAIEAGGVEYLGRMEDVRGAIAECNVYVLPSYREGTPRSVLEAMAMGRAIVTTDAPGCRQTVDEGRNGFLAAPRDPDSLEAAMGRFIADPGLIAPMGGESRRIAEARFDVDRVNAQILDAAGL